MPELVKGGPNIPVSLMNQLDEGRVVFFCGAGISKGPGSELPGFDALVTHVYTANTMEPDDVESAALDLGKEDPNHRRPNFDKALGLLERPERLGPQALRNTIIECLSKPSSAPLRVHQALLALSRGERGIRLVTTNFDNRFVEADPDTKFAIDSAPKLPIPKPLEWSSLVHLHGRIRSNDGESDLVLTAADFGRAYLTERWAARFITELFREFTVVFVGYSVSDPVMSYMIDALAAERAKGGRFASAYAFADQDGTEQGVRQARDQWRAKNVDPILYDRKGDHHLLADTLIEWARVRSDPFQARSQIAVDGITKMPAGPDDPLVERVVWALQDPVAAMALADTSPVDDENDFAKIDFWLAAFDQRGLLCCTADDAYSVIAEGSPAMVHLVDYGLQSRFPQSLDRTRACLARWIAKHLHVPQVLGWVLRNGGQLHPGLRQEIQMQLVDRGAGIPPRLRFLWTLALDQEPDDPWRSLWASKHHQAATSDSERHRIEDQVVSSLEPRLVVESGPSPQWAIQMYMDDRGIPASDIDRHGHPKLVVGGEYTQQHVKEILRVEAALSRHAETLAGHLERALELGAVADEIDKQSFQYCPSIAAHDQNSHRDEWTYIIDLARDSYFALAASNRPRADALLRRWVFSDHSVFRRLALHALTENPKADIRFARRLLIVGRKPGVWETDLRREVLRFFRLAGARLPRNVRVDVVRTIHAGPRPSPRKKWPGYPEYVHREKALRLHKLAASGARLDKKSRALADEIVPPQDGESVDREEFLHWRGKAEWLADGDFAPRDLTEGTVDQLMEAITNATVGEYEFRGLVLKRPIQVASALRRLSQLGDWPSEIWKFFLWEFDPPRKQPGHRRRLREHVARTLAAAPDELFSQVGAGAAGFIKAVADDYDTEREPELRALWRKAWDGATQTSVNADTFDDPLTQAMNHPAGKLVDAAWSRLSKYEPTAGSKLPQSIQPYFDAIAMDQGGHIGRVMLARRLYNLFAIDPDWTEQHLIARLGQPRSKETRDLWSAYCYSLHVGPDLLNAFQGSFLAMLRDGGEVGPHGNGLVKLFMTICLETPGALSTEDVGGVVESMPELFLETVLNSCSHRFAGELDERALVWREKIGPWLEQHWPKAGARNTPRTTTAMLEMLANCGGGFPEATAWALANLRWTKGEGLYELRQSKLGTHFPGPMLDILDYVVDESEFPVFKKSILREILDEVKAVDATCASDPRWQRLYRVATR